MVVVDELFTLRGEAIDVGRLVILAAEAGDVRVAEVIGQDEANIWPPDHSG